MAVTAILANLSCTDIDVSAAWYAHLFGREADASPMEGLREWYLGPEAGFQLFAGGAGVGSGTLTLRVTLLDAELLRLGIASAEEIEQGAHTRFLRLKDPDGNLVVLVESA
ncbi:VOC family protein [Sulfitobacter albidus]|uniref:VOC family protein n=1 Tax=Sulfitobacter albidus TaxID=2829501 RepID=A0A975JC41_9RHOB|nr:VOC family protein [Sulfitobacter albidus]QUJ75736.1 VOC family protein [Sulfitobacter albidus]